MNYRIAPSYEKEGWKIVRVEGKKAQIENTCSRCGGSGMYPSMEYNGICLRCNGSGKEYKVVNVEALNRFEDGTTVTPELLMEAGLVTKMLCGVKVLGNGTLEKNLTVVCHKVSKSAQAAIEKAGGKVEVL